MKKLFMNLLFAVLINGFTPATPANCITLVEGTNTNKAYISANYEIKHKAPGFEIHPLDILAFKFD
jgi:hypothetical protein